MAEKEPSGKTDKRLHLGEWEEVLEQELQLETERLELLRQREQRQQNWLEQQTLEFLGQQQRPKQEQQREQEWLERKSQVDKKRLELMELSKWNQRDLVPASGDSLSLYFDLENFSPTDIADILGLLSELYMDIGGEGLVIDDITLLEFEPALEPVEV